MELWPLGELAERVEMALAGYPGQANGRVRAVPDQRVIRWYTTIGLIDRPVEMRGRTALYGRRHLLQLAAIKRRQAQGHTLAQIQAELAGATNETLQPIAALPSDPSEPPAARPADTSEPPAGRPADPITTLPADLSESNTARLGDALGEDQARARFWSDRPPLAPADAPSPPQPALAPPSQPESPSPSQPESPSLSPSPSQPAVAPAPAPVAATAAEAGGRSRVQVSAAGRALSAAGPAAAEMVAAVRVADGVTVVLGQAVGAVPDPVRLAAAAGPLLAELARQGLLPQPSGDES